MKAFTYLVVNKLTGKWYYGVRYAKDCSEKDILTKYFTSSEDVKSDIKTFGADAFVWEVRRRFDDVKLALKWESCVLRRMKVTVNSQSYNKHWQMGFVVRCGEDNTSKLPEVRRKLSLAAQNRPPHSQEIIDNIIHTRTRNNIRREFTTKKFLIQKSKKVMYERHLLFMRTHKPKCRRMIRKLENILKDISAIKKKPYVRNVHTLRGKCPNISKAKKGGMWFTSPDLKQSKIFRNLDDVPEDWIAGLRTKSKIEKNRIASTGRRHTKQSKDLMRKSCSGKKYYTSPDYNQVKVFRNIEDVPANWIPGSKKKRIMRKQ